MLFLYDLIKVPIITEKSASLENSVKKKYTFEVSKKATKSLISLAVSKIFSVKVSSVNIINVQGKRKKFKGIMGKQSNIKKAIVTLYPGESIDIVSGGVN